MVRATINNVSFITPLEPDGKFSHYFLIDKKLLDSLGILEGSSTKTVIEPINDWPEPVIPADIQEALSYSPKARELWQNITTMSRWEWIRWIRSTPNSKTRSRRINVAISKLNSGKRRPCCWNRNLCTDPRVSKNGVLLDSIF